MIKQKLTQDCNLLLMSLHRLHMKIYIAPAVAWQILLYITGSYFVQFVISRGAEGPGREILQCPPSVRLSVRHV